MTRPFILSAALNDPALATPACLAQALKAAEAAGFDLVILGSAQNCPFDAQVLAAWVAPLTSTLGIVATVPASTAYPFHVARALSAVDFLAGGRAGWSVVPGGAEAAQADDLVDAVRALWDGWDADCLIIDKASGVYLDPSKVRASRYRGPFYSTQGPVNAMRPPQGHILLVSDGAAPLGVEAVDVALVDEGQDVPASRRLLKVGAEATPERLSARFAAGDIDGAHFSLTEMVSQLRDIGSRFAALRGPRSAQGQLRERLGLPLAAAAATHVAVLEKA